MSNLNGVIKQCLICFINKTEKMCVNELIVFLTKDLHRLMFTKIIYYINIIDLIECFYLLYYF